MTAMNSALPAALPAALLPVALLVLLGLAAALVWRLVALRQRLAALQQRLEALPVIPAASSRSIIAVEILNPMELARRESRLAGTAATLAPRLLERIVYARAAEQIAEQLRAEGVQAHVSAHVA